MPTPDLVALTEDLQKHRINTMSQDSGQHCTCGSDSRFQQANDPPWSIFEEHVAAMAVQHLFGAGGYALDSGGEGIEAVPAFRQTKPEGVVTAYYSAEELCRVVNAEKASVWAEALDVVKRACDIECQSPGTHTGCAHHEPYRVLRDRCAPWIDDGDG